MYISASDAYDFGSSTKRSSKKRTRKYVPHHLRSVESASKRNARERKRQTRLNDALEQLRDRLPTELTERKKLAKGAIMSAAVEYIEQLTTMLNR